MSRKKLNNNESFIFNESDVVNPTKNRGLLEKSSVQRRLFPKAETRQGPLSPVRSSHSSSNTQSFSYEKKGRADIARNHNDNKNTPTNDPSLETILAKLANLNTEFLPSSSNVRDGVRSIAWDGARSKLTEMAPTSRPGSIKRVLLQVVPSSAGQEILHPFKADFKKIHVSNNNSVLLNNNMVNDFHKTKTTATITESKQSMLLPRRAQTAGERGTFLTGPTAQDPEFVKQDCVEKEQDKAKICICLRPLKLILCPVCGYTTTGRLRKTCEVHPKALYLLDVDACPRCKETNNHVFMEYDLPEGFKQAAKKNYS